MRFTRAGLALLCLGLAGPAAVADRTRLLGESEAIEAGDCELEVAFERRSAPAAGQERTRERTRERDHQRAVQLGCGIGWHTELAATLTQKRRLGSSDTERSVSLEGKTLLQARSVGTLGWALLYGVHGERSATAWRRSGQFVELEASVQAWRAGLLYAQFGHLRDRSGRQDSSLWSLGLEHAVNERLEVRLTLVGDDRHRPAWGTALRWSVWPEQRALTLAFNAGAAQERSLGATLSFEF